MPVIKNYCPAAGLRTPRLAIFLSGSGSNAERILEKYRTDTNAPLQVAALVTDRPKTSRAAELGRQFDIPVIAEDIAMFYKKHGAKRISIATPEGRHIREAWTNALRVQLGPMRIDFGAFAGFIPLTNLAADFPCLNVHPGDLTYEKNGQRYLVGLHTIPVERAILEGLNHMRSSVIIVEPYEGAGDNMDAGPILGVSPQVAIDLRGRSLEALQMIAAKRPLARPVKGYQDELEAIAGHNQELLKENGDWVVFPQVLWAFARGAFGEDGQATLHYAADNSWLPVKTVAFGPEHARPMPR